MRNRSQSQATEAQSLFEDEIDVDIVGGSSYQVERSVSPPPVREKSSRRRGKKKVVYSDAEGDDEFIDAGRIVNDDEDGDFMEADSPPRKSGASRKSIGGTRGRGKGTKDKERKSGEIIMKDERRAPGKPNEGNSVHVGAKRRRETISEPNTEEGTNPDNTISRTSSLVSSSQPKEENRPAASSQPLPKIRKLPTIKKNKSTTQLSGPSTPVTAKGDSVAGGPSNNSSLPINVSLPRKPVGPLKRTNDIDLSSPDIYNSLFKGGASAPRAGVNSRFVATSFVVSSDLYT